MLIKLGGMGVLSHKEVAPIARLALKEMANIELGPLLDEVRPDSAADDVISQGHNDA